MISSLAVILSAGYAFKVWKESGAKDRAALLLIVLVFMIGVNSTLFHTVRTPFLFLAETLPIIIFILVAFGVILMRQFQQSLLYTSLHVAGFVAASMMVTLLLTPRALGNGSAYVVSLFTLYVVGTILILRARVAIHEDRILYGAAAARSNSRHFPELKMGYALVTVGVLLALGLFARSFDMAVCKHFPIGLHMLWHVVIAAALLVLTLAIIRHTRPISDIVDEQDTERPPGYLSGEWPPKNRPRLRLP